VAMQRPRGQAWAVVLFLSPVLSELFSGNLPPWLVILPPVLVFLFFAYGLPLAVIREGALFLRFDMRSLSLFGCAYGLYNEALISKSILTKEPPEEVDVQPKGVHWSGINYVWACYIVLWHTLHSIIYPLALFSLWKGGGVDSNFSWSPKLKHRRVAFFVVAFLLLFLTSILSFFFLSTERKLHDSWSAMYLPVIYSTMAILILAGFGVQRSKACTARNFVPVLPPLGSANAELVDLHLVTSEGGIAIENDMPRSFLRSPWYPACVGGAFYVIWHMGWGIFISHRAIRSSLPAIWLILCYGRYVELLSYLQLDRLPELAMVALGNYFYGSLFNALIFLWTHRYAQGATSLVFFVVFGGIIIYWASTIRKRRREAEIRERHQSSVSPSVWGKEGSAEEVDGGMSPERGAAAAAAGAASGGEAAFDGVVLEGRPEG